MKRDTMRAARLITAFIAAVGLSACASQQSATGPSAGLPAGGSGYQSSYAYQPDAFAPVGLQRLDPLSASLGDNQTVGFGANKRLVFTYNMQFDCVVQPEDDRNFNGKPADMDPKEIYTPECQIAAPSTISPSGISINKTDELYVLIPFFETNKKTGAFTPQLGKALKKLFGFIPDAFKPDPGVPVQCPAPKDKPGTCTMHPLQTDLGPLLTQMGLLPKNTNFFVPLVNHDHILNNSQINQASEWWIVKPVLVMDPKLWPNAQGTTGITSVAKMDEAEKDKKATESTSNFFLFFSSKVAAGANAQMPGMHT